MRSRLAWGAALWAVRPAYVAIELTVAGLTTGSYSIVDDTVSDLGALGCRVDYCSPASD